jgi:hypothetical protein
MMLRQAHLTRDTVELDLAQPPFAGVRIGRRQLGGATDHRIELLPREAPTDLVTHPTGVPSLVA